MLQTRKITRTILASMLAVMVAVSFYPATAFADTDYEAAYNQAKSNTQAAYTEWQNALTNVDTTYSTYQTAKANYQTAYDQIAVKKADMDKKHRILDYATRNAMDYFAQQAWNADYGNARPHPEWYYNTASRMDAVLNGNPSDAVNGTGSFVCGGTTHINRFKTNNTSDHSRINDRLNYGITKSTNGNDDTNSLTLYQKYVYFNESYDMLMYNLEYINECNQIRSSNQNSSYFSGPAIDLISPYLMVQAAVNAPLNIQNHNIRSTANTAGLRQNITNVWGKFNSTTSLDDPFVVLFYGEKNSQGAHYQNILSKHTHTGAACSWNFTSKTFEQDFADMSGATGYTVSQYRSMINNRVGSELSAYNNAVTAYNNAVDTAEDYADTRDDALDDYTDAQGLASQKETAYNNAVAAEEEAYQAWQEWLANQNNNNEPSNPPSGETPDPGTGNNPDPGDNPGTGDDPGTTPTNPTTPSNPDDEIGTVTGVTLTETSVDETNKKSTIKISCNAYPNAKVLAIYKSTSANGEYSLVGRFSAKNTNIRDTNAEWNTTYYYRVDAESDDYYTLIGRSNPVSIKTHTESTNPPANPPTTPSTDGSSGETGGGASNVGTIGNVKATQVINGQTVAVNITGNSVANAQWYTVRKSTDGTTFKRCKGIQNSNFTTITDTDVTWSTKYYYKVEAENQNGTVIATSNVVTITTSAKPAPPAPPKPTVGTSSITKTKVTAKSKKVDIWFSAAKNAKSYKVEIRRIYRLKGKKKIAVSSGWKAYNVTSPTKTAWVYKKKITAKQAKKYKGNANYKLTKSGKKYKLYHKENVAPVTATKLTRKSIYQVRVTAYNGSAHQTSVVKTFTIK